MTLPIKSENASGSLDGEQPEVIDNGLIYMNNHNPALNDKCVSFIELASKELGINAQVPFLAIEKANNIAGAVMVIHEPALLSINNNNNNVATAAQKGHLNLILRLTTFDELLLCSDNGLHDLISNKLQALKIELSK